MIQSHIPPRSPASPPEEQRDEKGDGDPEKPYRQGDAAAVEQPAEDVPAEVVGAEKEYRLSRGLRVGVAVGAEEVVPDGYHAPELCLGPHGKELHRGEMPLQAGIFPGVVVQEHQGLHLRPEPEGAGKS